MPETPSLPVRWPRRTALCVPLAALASACSGPDHRAPARMPSSSASASTGIETGGIVVDGAGAAGHRAELVPQIRQARAEVAQVWGAAATRATSTVRILVPGDQDEFVRRTGQSAQEVPARTLVDGSVLLNPLLWDRTTAQGRQVVLTHELTHVALGQQRWSRVARWIVEGSAELTAYRPTGLAPSRVADPVHRLVVAGRPPSGPPQDRDFGAAGGPAAAYAGAYAWCLFLERRRGWPVFVNFVRAVGRGTPAESAFRLAYGMDPQALAPAYRGFVRTTFGAQNP